MNDAIKLQIIEKLRDLCDGSLNGAEVAKEIFLDAGLVSERLILEPASRTSAENVSASLALRPDDREGEWLLVTSGFHLPRAIETF